MDGLSDAGEQIALMSCTRLVPNRTDMVNVATLGFRAIKDLAGALSYIGDTDIAGTTLAEIVDKITDFAIPGKLAAGTLMDMARSGDTVGGAFTETSGIFADFAGRVAA